MTQDEKWLKEMMGQFKDSDPYMVYNTVTGEDAESHTTYQDAVKAENILNEQANKGGMGHLLQFAIRIDQSKINWVKGK